MHLDGNEGKAINIRKYLYFRPKITNLCNRNYLETEKKKFSKTVIQTFGYYSHQNQ